MSQITFREVGELKVFFKDWRSWLDALATRIKEVTTSVTFKNTKHAKLNFVFKVLLS